MPSPRTADTRSAEIARKAREGNIYKIFSDLRLKHLCFIDRKSKSLRNRSKKGIDYPGDFRESQKKNLDPGAV
jgi:hypothetical protein